MLAAGWNVNNGSYVLTVVAHDERGALMNAAKEITRFCQIVNVISLDPDHSSVKSRFCLLCQQMLIMTEWSESFDG